MGAWNEPRNLLLVFHSPKVIERGTQEILFPSSAEPKIQRDPDSPHKRVDEFGEQNSLDDDRVKKGGLKAQGVDALIRPKLTFRESIFQDHAF